MAEVGPAVVTRSELESEARLALLLTRGPEVARTAALHEPLLRSVLRAIAQRELLLAEARRLSIREASQEELEQRVAAIFARFGSRADAIRFFERVGFSMGPEGAPPPGLVDQLRAELTVSRFVELRVRPNVSVRPDAVEACLAANPRQLAGIPVEQAKAAIEATLRDQAADRALAAVVAALERKTPVRTAPGLELGPLGAIPTPSPGALTCPAR